MALQLLTSARPSNDDLIAQELLDKRNWKQALANVERRLKKGRDERLLVSMMASSLPDSYLQDHPQLNREAINLYSGDPSRIQQGLHSLTELLQSKLQLDRTEVLQFIDQPVISGYLGDATIGHLWETYVASQPSNRELLNDWFMKCLTGADYLTAQKVLL